MCIRDRARVEPKEGEFSEAALNHYRDELTHLKSLGISPLITFYHFSHPMWFEEKGSFTKRENITYFLRFIERCLEAFGDLCQDYVCLLYTSRGTRDGIRRVSRGC